MKTGSAGSCIANEADHSADCSAYLYEVVPGRIFLDTNVVNLLVNYPEQIFRTAAAEP